MIEFMFGQSIVKFGLIDECSFLFESGSVTDFQIINSIPCLLRKSPGGSLFEAFSDARMRAAAIGPEPAGVVFALRALLDQKLNMKGSCPVGVVEKSFSEDEY